MELNCKYIDAAEVDDLFQVLFKVDKDDEADYFLIQRSFEFTNSNKCYIETKGEDYIGFYNIDNAILTINRLSIKINRDNLTEIFISFKISTEKYSKLKRILKIIIPSLLINESTHN